MTDTPDLSRAALEALAAFHERMAHGSKKFAGVSDVYKIAMATAATLRALASRAEPPADVAALVERADALWQSDDRVQDMSDVDEIARFIARLAAALTVQAERIAELEAAYRATSRSAFMTKQHLDAQIARAEKAEALNREAGKMLEAMADLVRLGASPGAFRNGVTDALGWMDEGEIRASNLEGAARALGAKLKGEAVSPPDTQA